MIVNSIVIHAELKRNPHACASHRDAFETKMNKQKPPQFTATRNRQQRQKEKIRQELKYVFVLHGMYLLLFMNIARCVMLFHMSMLCIPWDMKKRQLIRPLFHLMTSIYISWNAVLQFNHHSFQESTKYIFD